MSGRTEDMTGRMPQELVDRFFDRELDEGSREKFFGMLRADLSRCAEVAKTQRMISILREPIEGPDLTGEIMSRIARRRGFLPERLRRMITASRLAAAACVLLAVLGLAVARRVSPDTFRLGRVERPISGVIESGKTDAASVHAAWSEAVAAPITAITLEGRRASRSLVLSPGRVSVRTLVQPGGASLQLPLGSGNEARFVFVGGVCIDRRSAASVALGCGPAPASCAAFQGAMDQFIARIVQQNEADSSGPSAAGRNSVE